MHVPEGEAYAAVEHPKGEFGIYIVSRRRQQAVPPEDPRARLRAPGGARRDGARPHDRRRRRDHRHAWTSCSERSTDERADARRCCCCRTRSRGSTREVAKYPPEQKQSAVMAALAIAQDEQGWLSHGGDGRRRRATSACRRSRCTRSRPSTTCTTCSRSARYKLHVCTNLPCELHGRRTRCEHLKQQARHRLRRDHRRRHVHAEGRRVPGRLRRRAGACWSTTSACAAS